MSSHDFSITDDFSNGVNLKRLKEEINNNISKIYRIVLIGDIVRIVFDVALDAGEITTLNGVISSHDSTVSASATKVLNITVPHIPIDKTVYVNIGSFNFPGTNNLSNVDQIKVISFMEQGGTSYDVRLCDVTNNTIIASANLSNNEEQMNSLGLISNLPLTESIFEIQSKIDGSTTAYICNLNIYHD